MTAIKAVQLLMENQDVTQSELAEYAELKSQSNVAQMLSRNDLKVRTFVKILEVLGYQLIAQNPETNDELVIDEG